MRVSRAKPRPTAEVQTPKKRTYLYPHEVFAKLNSIESFHERVKYLQENASFAIKTILQCNFSKLVLELPDGMPPFKEDPMPSGYNLTRIDKAIGILPRLIKEDTPAPALTRIKKETMFIRLLESIHKDDAAILVYMKDKEITKHYPNVDITLVKTAFPTLV
jgi:hypothetical protein